MIKKHYEPLPWIVVFIVAMLVIAVVAWLGYDNWYTFEDITK